jgi:ribosomal 50S subunit-recycling heat shock protein
MKERGEQGGVRLDKWLWAARFFRPSPRREAIDGGRVRGTRTR